MDNKQLIVISLLFFVFISFGVVSNSVSAATPLYVNGDSGDDTFDGTSATHDAGTVGPKKTIQNAIGAVDNSGVVNVADGTYNEHLTISKSVTINGASRENTIIDANGWTGITISGTPTVHINHLTLRNGNTNTLAGGIYNTGTLYISDSTLSGNHASGGYGGAIYNTGTLYISDSILSGNTANSGAISGGIFNSLSGSVYISDSTLSGNIAGDDGGAIYNDGTFSITGSTLADNTATHGGAIYNAGTLSITGSTLSGNHANSEQHGNAIANQRTLTANFNRIVNNMHTVDIYTSGGTINVENNWWGSNDSPLGKVYDGLTVVNVNKWLVLRSTANPSSIVKNGNSIITVDLQHDNGIVTDPNHPDLYYHDPDDGHVPDAIQVDFVTTLGTILSPSYMNDGAVQSTLNGGTVQGVADVTSTVDGVSVHSTVKIDTTAPTAGANVKGGLYNVNKRVSLFMSETGTIYYTKNGINPTTASTKYVGPILITTNTVLKFLAVDTAGNPSVVYTVNYLIDKIAPKISSTYPKNKAKNVFRTKTISIKFSENIKSSSAWSKIVVKNKKGKKVSIKKWIKGNKLYIKTRKKLSRNSYFTIHIPKYAVKDLAGNKLAKKYTFKFKTKK